MPKYKLIVFEKETKEYEVEAESPDEVEAIYYGTELGKISDGVVIDSEYEIEDITEL